VVELNFVYIIEIFKGLCDCYEVYYCVLIVDGVLVGVVILVDCYINDCFLFDKVIDFIDEVGVCLCICWMMVLLDLCEFDECIVVMCCEKELVIDV